MKSFAMFSQLHLVGSFCPKPNEFQFWSHHCVECGLKSSRFHSFLRKYYCVPKP
jgi:hypothetical protein